MAKGNDKKYQLFDALPDKEYQALKKDILERGILVPIEVDESGNILDGNHRVRAWQELKDAGELIKDYPRLVRLGWSEEQKRLHIRALNLLRRHLTKAERVSHWQAMRQDGMTLTAIAEVSGVSHVTVRRATKDSTLTNVKVEGKDGKKRPTKYKPRKPKGTTIFVQNEKEQKRAQLVATVPLPDRMVTLKRAERISREVSSKVRASNISADIVAGEIQLWLGDFRQRQNEIADNSIDLVFTDPPYEKDSLPLWNDLGKFCSRKLKSNGILITYAGAMYLPDILESLGKSLEFWWIGAAIMNGPHSRVHARQIVQGSKPLLFFVPTNYFPNCWYEDTYTSEGEQKVYHDWQQSLGLARYYIETLTSKDSLVVDPFLGGGTTAVAAKAASRNFIGIEIDAATLDIARERLDNG